MSRFHQRLNEDLQDAEFAEAFYDMSADIAVLPESLSFLAKIVKLFLANVTTLKKFLKIGFF